MSILDQKIRWKDREFDCVHDVEVRDLLNILDDWEKGRCEAVKVFSFAEGIESISGGIPEYPRSDKRSIVSLVLYFLNMIYTMPILKRDIQIFKKALIISKKDPSLAHDKIDKYFNDVDDDDRSQYLGDEYPDY